MLEFNNFFKQCVAGGLELATLVFREKHLSHGGVLFLVNLGMVFAVTIPVFKMGAKPHCRSVGVNHLFYQVESPSAVL